MKKIIPLAVACLLSSSAFAEAQGQCYQMLVRSSTQFSIVIQYTPCLNGAPVMNPGTQVPGKVEQVIPKNSYVLIPVVKESAIQYRDESSGSYSEPNFNSEVYVPAAKQRNMDCSTFNNYSICYLYKQNGYASAWESQQKQSCSGSLATGFTCQ